MSARIRGASTELEELNEETDEYTETTSKLRDLVMGLTGFDIMEDEDTYKDIYEIILGIGKEWDNLTDIEQASLGEALAGKRNANALYAVLGNLDTLQAAYETAENSAGSAMKEQENYEKSIQYSIDRLSASVEEWSEKLVSSSVVKWFVDVANAAVNLSTTLTPLGTIAAGIGAALSVKNAGNVHKCVRSNCFEYAYHA
jgi:TP901 family phage tail tape measure protein